MIKKILDKTSGILLLDVMAGRKKSAVTYQVLLLAMEAASVTKWESNLNLW